MKKTGFILQVLCCLCALTLIITPVAATSTETDMSITQGCRTLDGGVPLLEPLEDLSEASSALLYDVTNDTLLYAQNPDQQEFPAGLVKIMTGLIVAEKGNLTDMVTISQETLDKVSSGTSVNLMDGEIMSLESLLYCILLEGDNEAAIIAAEYLCGSQEAFVLEMNARAAELGCTGTNFVNVHGLHDDLQVTTARDMAKILSAACQNEAFKEIYTTYIVRIPATNMAEERRIANGSFIFNQNLGSNHFDKRVTGSRYGTTSSGGWNLANTAESNGIELITIILNSVSEINPDGSTGFYKESRILMDKGFKECRHVYVLQENQVMDQFEVKNGDSYVTACVKTSVLNTLPLSVSDSELTYRYEQSTDGIQAPIQTGDNLGLVRVWYQNVCLAQAELYALHDVGIQEVIDTEDLTAESGSSAMTILMIVAVIVGLLIVLLFGRRLIFRTIRNHQMRRHSAKRRRSR